MRCSAPTIGSHTQCSKAGIAGMAPMPCRGWRAGYDENRTENQMTTETAALSVPRPGFARLAVATIFCLNGLALANWIARIPDVKQQLALSEQRLGLVLLCVAAGALVAQPIVG